MMDRARHFIVTVILLIMTSCSRLEIALQWADFLVAQVVDSYFDIDSQQKKKIKAAVNQFINEAREKELKNIAHTLRLIAERVESKGLSEEDIEEFYAKIQSHVQMFFAELAPYVGEQAIEIAPKQWSYYLKKIQKQVDEARTEMTKRPERWDREREERFEDQLVFWLGGLNRDQKQKIRTFVRQNPFPWELFFQNRLSLATKLADPSWDGQARRAFIEKMLTDFSYGRSVEYVEAQQKYQKKVYALVTEILMSIDDSQRKHLVKKLKKIALSFEKLRKA